MNKEVRAMRHMDPKAEVVGVYPVETREPCHLIELSIHGFVGELDLAEFTQEISGQPRDYWQVPWDERVLDREGASQTNEQFPSQIRSDGTPFRLVFFFHYLQLAVPLRSPFGALPLPAPTERPSRLAFIEYDPPEGTDDEENRPAVVGPTPAPPANPTPFPATISTTDSLTVFRSRFSA